MNVVKLRNRDALHNFVRAVVARAHRVPSVAINDDTQLGQKGFDIFTSLVMYTGHAAECILPALQTMTVRDAVETFHRVLLEWNAYECS